MRGNRRHAASAVDAETILPPCTWISPVAALSVTVHWVGIADRHYGVISIQVLIISGVAMSSSSG